METISERLARRSDELADSIHSGKRYTKPPRPTLEVRSRTWRNKATIERRILGKGL